MHRPLTYRPEIDGLRAFAVISVLIYHLNSDWLPGGYLGVDVFFVISGFLITSIIVKDCASGDFSFKDFYMRRIRRILPAMLTVTTFTCIAAYFVLFPDEMKVAAKACKKALLCCSNYYFAKESGYFDPTAEANPFLHTWSLGVEEQFYFIFPLLALLAHRRGYLKARYLGAFVFIGLAVSCFMTLKYPTRAFFTLESRAWELAAGAWLAVAVSRGTVPNWLASKATAAVALVLLLVSVVFLDHGSMTPAPMAALAVFGTVLFISSRAGGGGSIGYRVFTAPSMRFVGRISYSLYLVHWPLIVFARAWYGEVTPGQLAVVATASVVLAIALHYAIEQPLRHRRKPVPFLTGVVATVTLIYFCTNYAYEEDGLVNDTKVAGLISIVPEWGGSMNERKSPYLIGRTDVEPTMVLLGDSHAHVLVPSLDSELNKRGISCEVWMSPGSCPILGVFVKGRKSITEEAIASLSRPSITRVVLAARWTSYLKKEGKDNSPTKIIGAKTTAEGLTILRNGMDKTFSKLREEDREIVLVYPIPEVELSVPYYLARKKQSGNSISNLTLEAPARDYPSRHDLTIPLFGEMCRKYNLLPVYPDKLLIHDGALQISQGDLALYTDDNHLSHAGSTKVIKEVMSKFTWSPPEDAPHTQ